MGMKRFCFALLWVLASTASSLWGSVESVRNGHWWQKIEGHQRAAYVTGLLDGISADQLFIAGDFPSAALAYKQGAVMKQLLYGIDSDEILRRLERFYQERRNQPIIVGEAMILVLLQSQRMSPEIKKMFGDALADARKRGAQREHP